MVNLFANLAWKNSRRRLWAELGGLTAYSVALRKLSESGPASSCRSKSKQLAWNPVAVSCADGPHSGHR